MKKQLLVFLLLFSTFAYAQVTQRNILGKKYTLDAVKQAVVPKSQWKPYPKTVDEWKAALPDSIIKKLISNGEEALKYKFTPISATNSMDYVRSGDREQHSKISFGKRNTLVELILAESVEDKGRFTEAIFNLA